jgi:S-adenosylmethionine:tRNA ribosyltransferase-isomerase
VRLSELQYTLPAELIAQHPSQRRDASRLLVLERATGRVTHALFRDLTQYLNRDDCLVVNDTRVIPARFHCTRATGGRVEALFLHEDAGGWQVLLKPSARLKLGERLTCEGADVALRLAEKGERGQWVVQPEPAVNSLELLNRIGQTPLPPYIRRGAFTPERVVSEDIERYQTVYARRPGAVAAPTAGLHLTDALLAALARAGVVRAAVTLHVGAGTFAPVVEEDLARHAMHAEWFEVMPQAIETLRAARARAGRVVAVGTTATRVLESLGRDAADADGLQAQAGWTDIFIYPPYRFRLVDVLITNFHLPGSTLLALVMAFASPEQIRAAYAEAICERYRFYSYGDAMLIL